eukprot:393458_1
MIMPKVVWWLILFLYISYSDHRRLIIYSIHNNDPQQYAAQKFAVRQINQNSALLPNYTIELLPQDANHSNIRAFKRAMALISQTASSLVTHNSSIIIPIVLGCPYSSMSIMAAPALKAFSFGMISSSATSMQLS